MRANQNEIEKIVKSEIEKWGSQKIALLPVLQAIQEKEGYLSRESLEHLQELTKIPVAQLFSIASFYDDFRFDPPAQWIISVCDGLICQSGSSFVRAIIGEVTGVQGEGTSTDGRFQVKRVNCLGQCDNHPAIKINDKIFAGFTENELQKLLVYLSKNTKYQSSWNGKSGSPKPISLVENGIFNRPGCASFEEWERQGNGKFLKEVIRSKSPKELIEEITRAGLRGHGGAGFPTGKKWQLARDQSQPAILICNGDESEPFTFKDRSLLTHFPMAVLEGMIEGGLAIGADQGYIYLRSDYRYLQPKLERLIGNLRERGFLGQNIFGTSFCFDIQVFLGAGAYICGEESALIESMEGKRGEPRLRPPFPVESGLLGKPTVVNNVETFAHGALIVKKGASWFKKEGTKDSPGTKICSVSGDILNPGVYEIPLGLPLERLISAVGGLKNNGDKFGFALLGGAAGRIIKAGEVAIPLDFDHGIANGSVVVFSDKQPKHRVVKNLVQFFQREFCGACIPCRDGVAQAHSLVQVEGDSDFESIKPALTKLVHCTKEASRCGLGKTALRAVSELIEIDDTKLALPLSKKDENKNPESVPKTENGAWINGQKTEVIPGQTIHNAAESLGISIPKLCRDEFKNNKASCRLCVVEVEGKAEMVASCHTLLSSGAKIFTHSDRVTAVRKTILELALGGTPRGNGEDHPKSKLEKMARELGIAEGETGAYKISKNFFDDPLLFYDSTRCIRCDLCARYCQNKQNISAIAPMGRGSQSYIGTAFGTPLQMTECRHCGGCAVSCPTGALVEKVNQIEVGDEKRGPTLCPYCGTGCQIFAYVRNKKIVAIESAGSAHGQSFNQGDLCVKGRLAFDFVHHPDRITTPLIRDPNSTGTSKFPGFRTAPWEEALNLVAKKLTAIKNEFGPEAIMGISSSRATNEENFLMQKFMRHVVGTNNVDNCARVCHSPSVSGLSAVFGGGAATNSLDEIQETEVLFLIGCNPTEAHPVIGMRIQQALQKGVKLIVIDPRRIDLARSADIWLPMRPGTNVAILNGIANVIFQNKLHDSAFISERTEGFEAFCQTIETYTLSHVEKITGVSGDLIEKSALLYGSAGKAMILYGLGITEHTDGTLGVMGCANLALLTGNVGKKGTGVNPLRGQNNVQGACDMGALPNVLPGYQSVKDPEVGEKFAKAWGRPLPKDQGLKLTEAWHEARKGRIRSAYIFAADPAQTDPDTTQVIKALENLDFLIVQELFMTKTAKLADVILPAASFAEKEGSFTNADRRVQKLNQIIEPLTGCKTDLDIITKIARKMDPFFPEKSPAQVMDEIAELTPTMAGISYQRLDHSHLVWPCLDRGDQGAKTLYEREFPRGKATFQAIEHSEARESYDETYPFILTTGRRLEHYNCGSMSRRTEILNALSPGEYLEINPADGLKLGLKDNQMVEVKSRRGSLSVPCRLSERCQPGIVFLSFHFTEVATNDLVGHHLDALACTPEYKVSAVSVRPVK